MRADEFDAIRRRNAEWEENPNYPTTDSGGRDRRVLLGRIAELEHEQARWRGQLKQLLDRSQAQEEEIASLKQQLAIGPPAGPLAVDDNKPFPGYTRLPAVPGKSYLFVLHPNSTFEEYVQD